MNHSDARAWQSHEGWPRIIASTSAAMDWVSWSAAARWRAISAKLPALPTANAAGHIPAVEYAQASLARKLIRRRWNVGLTQAALARKAGIRPETLNRIEKGKSTPDTSTVEKLIRALERAEAITTEKR